MGTGLAADAQATGPGGMTAGAWLRGGFALIVAAAFVLVLMTEVGYAMGADWQLRYRDWVASSADAVNRAVGGDFVRTGSAFIRGTADGGSAMTIAPEAMAEWAPTIPTLAAAVALATLFAARAGRLGWKTAAGLVVLGTALVVAGWPVLSGVLQGLGIGLAGGLGPRSVWVIQWWLRDVAPVLVCAIAAGGWWLAVRVRGAEKLTGPAPVGRPEHVWWAVGVSSVVAVVTCLAAAAGIIEAATVRVEGQWLNAARFSVRGGLAAVTAVMAVVALVRGRGSRYGWMPAALAGMAGGEAAGGLVLLLMVVLRMDVVTPAGADVAED